MKSIADLRDINSGAIAKMEQSVGEIDDMIDDTNLSLADESRLISRRATLQAQINNQMMIQAHLKAGAVIVSFTAKDETDLDTLNAEMEKFIIQGLTANAIIGLVPKIIDTATAIGSSVTAHTGTAG